MGQGAGHLRDRHDVPELHFHLSKGAWGGLAVAVVIFAIFLDRRPIALMGVAGVGAPAGNPAHCEPHYLSVYCRLPLQQAAALAVIRWSKGLKLQRESNPVLGFGLGRFGGAGCHAEQGHQGETKDFSYFYMDNYYLKRWSRWVISVWRSSSRCCSV